MRTEKDMPKKARYFQLKRIDRGICPTCPNAIPEGWRKPCVQCLIKKREQEQRRGGHAPWVRGKRGRPPKYFLTTPQNENI
jgi:hypothetical protein